MCFGCPLCKGPPDGRALLFADHGLTDPWCDPVLSSKHVGMRPCVDIFRRSSGRARASAVRHAVAADRDKARRDARAKRTWVCVARVVNAVAAPASFGAWHAEVHAAWDRLGAADDIGALVAEAEAVHRWATGETWAGRPRRNSGPPPRADRRGVHLLRYVRGLGHRGDRIHALCDVCAGWLDLLIFAHLQAEWVRHLERSRGGPPSRQLCLACQDDVADQVLTACGHQSFCGPCLQAWTNGGGRVSGGVTCPVCRVPSSLLAAYGGSAFAAHEDWHRGADTPQAAAEDNTLLCASHQGFPLPGASMGVARAAAVAIGAVALAGALVWWTRPSDDVGD